MSTPPAARLGAIFYPSVEAALPPTFRPPHLTGQTISIDAGNVAHSEQAAPIANAITCALRRSILILSVAVDDTNSITTLVHDAPLRYVRKGDVGETSDYSKASVNEGVTKKGDIFDRPQHANQEV
jgi:hypothetical protein